MTYVMDRMRLGVVMVGHGRLVGVGVAAGLSPLFDALILGFAGQD